jgi:hypothetical protein
VKELFDPPAIVRTVDALAEIAAQINAGHQQVQNAIRASLERARDVGQLLIKAKGQCQHGQWLPWLKANVKFSERTAQNYVNVAKRWNEIESKSATVADLSYRNALEFLSAPESPSTEPVIDAEETAGILRKASGNPKKSLQLEKLKLLWQLVELQVRDMTEQERRKEVVSWHKIDPRMEAILRRKWLREIEPDDLIELLPYSECGWPCRCKACLARNK